MLLDTIAKMSELGGTEETVALAIEETAILRNDDRKYPDSLVNCKY
jgi:hypothetical protein